MKNMKLVKLLVLAIFTLVFIDCRGYHYYRDMADSPAVDTQEENVRGRMVTITKKVDGKDVTTTEYMPGNLYPPKGSIAMNAVYYPLIDTKEAKSNEEIAEVQASYDKATKVLKVPDNYNAERGKEQYSIYCQPCHGNIGAGDGKVVRKFKTIKAIAGPKSKADGYSAQKIYHIMRIGIGTMPGYKTQIYHDSDRWNIAQYVKYLQKNYKDLEKVEKARIAKEEAEKSKKKGHH